MKAQVGDRLVVESAHVGAVRKVGVVMELRHPDGTPPYLVRWEGTEAEALVFPGPEARVESVTA
jgi:hypothetical protein